jgi:hypothetical protein
MTDHYISFVGRPDASNNGLGEKYSKVGYQFPDGREIASRTVAMAWKEWNRRERNNVPVEVTFLGTYTSSWAGVLSYLELSGAEADALEIELAEQQEIALENSNMAVEQKCLSKLEELAKRDIGMSVFCSQIPEGWESEPTNMVEMFRDKFKSGDTIYVDITHGTKVHSHLLFQSVLAAMYAVGSGMANVRVSYAALDRRTQNQVIGNPARVIFLERFVADVERIHLVDAFNRTGDLRALLPGIVDKTLASQISSLAHSLMINDFDQAKIKAGQAKGQLAKGERSLFSTLLRQSLDMLLIEDTVARGFAYVGYHMQQGNLDRALLMLFDTVQTEVFRKVGVAEKDEYSAADYKKLRQFLGEHEAGLRYSKMRWMRNWVAHAQVNLSIDANEKREQERVCAIFRDPKKLRDFLRIELEFFQKMLL